MNHIIAMQIFECLTNTSRDISNLRFSQWLLQLNHHTIHSTSTAKLKHHTQFVLVEIASQHSYNVFMTTLTQNFNFDQKVLQFFSILNFNTLKSWCIEVRENMDESDLCCRQLT